MGSVVALTHAEHEQWIGLTRRASRPESPYRSGSPVPAEAAAVLLAGLRVVLGAEVVAGLAGEQWEVCVVSSESVPDASRVIRGAVVIFHHAPAAWILFGDQDGQLHVLDSSTVPQGAPGPLLVDRAPRPAEYVTSAEATAMSEHDVQVHTPQLQPYYVRDVAVALAFDHPSGTWYRLTRVAGAPAEEL